jgi:hypothetical protein
MPPKKNTKRKDPPPPAEEAATEDPANQLAEPSSSDKKKKKGRALSVPNFTEEEDYVLCVAYVNVSQNPIKGTDQTSADFWSDIETKYSMEMEKTHPGNPYPKRPSLSLNNRFQRNIKRTTNLFMPFWKRVHDAPPSGVATEEEIIEKACEEYLEFYGKPFPFVKCLEVLKGLCNFNPITYNDPSEDDVVDLVQQNLSKEEAGDGDKKPAAVNKITAVMGVGLARPIGNKKAKKLLKADTSSVSSAQAGRLAEANELLAHSQKELAMSQRMMAKAMSDKEDRAQIIALFKMSQTMGDVDGMKRAQQELLGLREAAPAPPSAAARDQSSVEDSLGDSTEEVVSEIDLEAV